MRRLRKIIFWCHLPVGVIAGIIILIMSVTGVLLAYEKQIIAWADSRNCRDVAAGPDRPRLPVEGLIRGVKLKAPDEPPTAMTVRSDPEAPVAFTLSSGRILFVDPYTGEIVGAGSKGARDFFRTVTDWHRWLGAQGENRTVARAITGACNIGFLFLVSSGFYLWWPRGWTWSQFKKILWFKRRLSGKARDFNWHNVIGIWSAVPLFIIVLSATVISYTWASNLVYRIAGETPPAPRAAPAQQAGNAMPKPEASDVSPTVGLEELLMQAEHQAADWQSISLRLPASAEEPLTLTVDGGNGGQPQKRGQFVLDRKSGESRWESFSSYTPGRKVRSILRFAHTGEVAGATGQTIAAIASLGGSVLAVTGLALAWRRFRAWLARARAGGTVQVGSQMAESGGE
ncbi:MAG TPA: PepSY-associated TM helix domain-containing protein [Blastocatellia bacterium]|nr:PepSY-associated TM helix domain-containing protein [Blastocatellia bacterium]